MTYGYTSPTATTEEDWINDVLSASVPLTSCNSNDNLNMEFGLYFPSTVKEEDDVFSNTSSLCTASSTPPTMVPAEPKDTVKDLSLLDSVSSKLEMMQKNHSLTPKALELIFNTKDVLKESLDWMLNGVHHKSCAKKLACALKKRKLRRKSSAACKRDQYKIEKKTSCCEPYSQLSTAQTSPLALEDKHYNHLPSQVASQVASQVNSALASKVVSRRNSVDELLLMGLIDPVAESPEAEQQQQQNDDDENGLWNARFDYAFGYDDTVVFPPIGAPQDTNDDLMKMYMPGFAI